MKMEVSATTVAFSQLMKATVLAESSSFIHFHHDLSALSMSTDISHVGVALFPSF
jgi:hypothetical protein